MVSNLETNLNEIQVSIVESARSLIYDLVREQRQHTLNNLDVGYMALYEAGKHELLPAMSKERLRRYHAIADEANSLFIDFMQMWSKAIELVNNSDREKVLRSAVLFVATYLNVVECQLGDDIYGS